MTPPDVVDNLNGGDTAQGQGASNRGEQKLEGQSDNIDIKYNVQRGAENKDNQKKEVQHTDKELESIVVQQGDENASNQIHEDTGDLTLSDNRADAFKGQPKTGSWPPSLHIRRPEDAMEAFLQAANASVSAETMQNISPSFADALDWIRARKTDLNAAFRLVHLYPNLIHDECLDGLWDFLLPFIQKGTGLKVPTLEEQHLALHGGSEHALVPGRSPHFGIHRNKSRSRHSEKGFRTKCAIPKLLYVSCHRMEKDDIEDNFRTNFTQSDLNELVMTLSETCFVQCSPQGQKSRKQPQPPSKAICQTQVFVFLIDKHSLDDEICVDELEEAFKLSIPIVIIKKKDYELPETLPARIENTRIPRRQSSRQPTTVTVSSIRSSTMQKAEELFLSPLPRPANTDAPKIPIYSKMNHTTGITLQKSSTEEDTAEPTMEELIRKTVSKSVIYDVIDRQASVENVLSRVRLFLGRRITGGHEVYRCDGNKHGSNSKDKLLKNMGSIVPREGLSAGTPGSNRWSTRTPRPISVRSAPECNHSPQPAISPNRPLYSQSQYLLPHPPETTPASQMNNFSLLPPIDSPTPLWKHRSHEILSPRPFGSRSELTTDRRTNYLLLRQPGSKMEVVPWPPEEKASSDKGEQLSFCDEQYYQNRSQNSSEELYGLDETSDSEEFMSNALSSVDINLRSLSVTPDLV